MTKKRKLNKPVLGIDQLSDETSLLRDSREGITAVREAINVDIDAEGNVGRRSGYETKISGSGFHSLFSTTRGALLVCRRDELGIYDPAAETFTAVTSMSEAFLTSFDELNGNVYFTNSGYHGMMFAGNFNVRPIGVPLPSVTAGFAAISNGSLAAGRYGITYSIVNDLGEESPLAPLMVVTIPEAGGGIVGTAFTLIADYKYRIYMTATDGEELYQAFEAGADSASFYILDHEEGRRPATQYLRQLPFGHILRAHSSRLYVATRDFIFFSKPFMPHLTNPAHDFLPCAGFVTMMQPVDGGIYVADQAGIHFFAGDDPTEFVVKTVSTESVVFNSAVSVPGEFFPPDIGKGADSVAVWLSPSGYQVGLPTGEVVRLHTKQVQLPSYVQGCAAFSIQDGRKQLVTPVNSNVLADANVALDSIIS